MSDYLLLSFGFIRDFLVLTLLLFLVLTLLLFLKPYQGCSVGTTGGEDEKASPKVNPVNDALDNLTLIVQVRPLFLFLSCMTILEEVFLS